MGGWGGSVWTSVEPRRIVVQYGYLKTLPDDYTGPRHVATVMQLPPGPDGENWFEWEERPGPAPASNATGPNDELLVHVCYVEKSRLESSVLAGPDAASDLTPGVGQGDRVLNPRMRRSPRTRA